MGKAVHQVPRGIIPGLKALTVRLEWGSRTCVRYQGTHTTLGTEIMIRDRNAEEECPGPVKTGFLQKKELELSLQDQWGL